MDLSEKVASRLAQKKTIASHSRVSLIEVFRTNFKAFSDLVVFYEKNPGYAEESGETAYEEIQAILTEANVLTKKGEPLSIGMIGNYMSEVRKKNAGQKRISRVKSAVGTPPPSAPSVASAKPSQAAGGSSVQAGSVQFVRPEPIEISNHDEELKRVKSDLSEWNGRDEYLWLTISAKYPNVHFLNSDWQLVVGEPDKTLITYLRMKILKLKIEKYFR
ncbi:MAG TPA: hypothetical protein VM577_05780 [Anaerovoracaceae bacterium]|nr:hypothetical protein [Anaerovoracaceae bacterium]